MYFYYKYNFFFLFYIEKFQLSSKITFPEKILSSKHTLIMFNSGIPQKSKEKHVFMMLKVAKNINHFIAKTRAQN